jgi:hypothetical protein
MKRQGLILKIMVIVIQLMFITQASNGQELSSYENETPENNIADNEDTRDNVPIDGGLSILIAAGIGYGAKKAYNKRKEQNIPNDRKSSN